MTAKADSWTCWQNRRTSLVDKTRSWVYERLEHIHGSCYIYRHALCAVELLHRVHIDIPIQEWWESLDMVLNRPSENSGLLFWTRKQQLFQRFPIAEEKGETETNDWTNQKIRTQMKSQKGVGLPSADRLPDENPAGIPKSRKVALERGSRAKLTLGPPWATFDASMYLSYHQFS